MGTKKIGAALSAAVVGFTAVGAEVVEEPSGYDLWGMREKHVAIVNPVLGQDARWVKTLAGEWEFCTRKFVPERNASWGVMFAHQQDWPDTRKIRVPGNVESQGVGEPGMSRSWDCFWDCSPKPMTHVFYGAAWYRRWEEIPASWAGRRIWFKVGGVTSQGWLWVNDTQVAWLESYCGTYKYDITDLVKPGEKAKIVLQVSNEVAKRAGASNSPNLWLGVSRDLELEATPSAAYIDDAWVRGDFDARRAQVKVSVRFGDEVVGDEVEKLGRGRQRSVDLSLRVTIDGERVERPLSNSNSNSSSLSTSTYTLDLALRAFRPWSPEHPNLYTARVDLVENGEVIQTRLERFGVRKFEVRGKDFYLNGQPFFVRGIGYHNVQPVYGPSRIADRDYRRFEVKRMRDAGFNFLRTHTRCETPEFFEACDELGMMVEPEMPYYNDQPCEKFEFNPVRDAKELFIHRRRHPSFAVYSHGNEGSFGPALGNYLYKMIKAMDPDRLVIEQDGGSFNDFGPGCLEISKKFNPKERADFVGGPIDEWPRGSAKSDRPIVAHEYLNLSVKANAELEQKYTGIWQVPFTQEKRNAFLAQFGLTDFWGKRLQLAQHKLQAYWFKHGIESARQDPECDGYYYWSAQDCTTPTEKDGVKTYTAQGLFDPFWGDKPGGHTTASVAVFNSPCAVFCDTFPSNRIFVAGEQVRNEIQFANYGDGPISQAKLVWRLVAKRNDSVLAQGEQSVGNLAVGGVRKIAEVDFSAPSVSAAVAARFEVALGDVKNAWDMWVFPKRAVKSAPGVCIVEPLLAKLGSRYSDLVPPAEVAKAKVVVAPMDSAEAKAAVARGQNVIAIGPAEGDSDVKLGWWWLGDQVGTAFAKDPVFRYLPHSGVLDPLFFRIFKKGVKLPLAGVSEQDLLAVCEGGYACQCNLAVRRHGTAREYLVYGLDVCADLPEAKALLDGIVAASCE